MLKLNYKYLLLIILINQYKMRHYIAGAAVINLDLFDDSEAVNIDHGILRWRSER